ncbi:sugar O-acyltransferase, sialic acid O-acetyltransferase NeuD family [Anaerovibrio lipolyticus DSM 3074]|uniref:Sugar O-acyltransferase, sialic acid O-acetyltransferase NeuD family n=2 Tax=Anaerovibrio lipolyticus TaxID=82374 RepID=A0A1M6FEI9_9FIRM|nr:sugar O-acyltransferase, sialic acid O-acetyltransferase NeuD family [Anaerovibrio lipolyticus DSM 3074]
MIMEDILIVGFGGHAKSVADCIEREGKYHIVGYTDMREADSRYSYLGSDDELQAIFDGGVKNAIIGIGYMGKSAVRQHLYATLKKMGFYLPVVTDPSAIVSSTAVVGEGTFIGKCAVINAEANIGKMAIINTKVLIEHECVVDDFSHVAVGAVLCGQVKVGKAAFIGANATVIQCRQIESNGIVPAGATIR